MTTRPHLRRLAPVAAVAAGLIAVSSASGAVAGAMITGADVKDASLTGKDIKDGTIGYADTSVQLDREHRKLGGYLVVRRSAEILDNQSGQVSASCPGGRSLLGTAAWWKLSNTGVQVAVDQTASYTRQATAFGDNDVAGPDRLYLQLFCGYTTN